MYTAVVYCAPSPVRNATISSAVCSSRGGGVVYVLVRRPAAANVASMPAQGAPEFSVRTLPTAAIYAGRMVIVCTGLLCSPQA